MLDVSEDVETLIPYSGWQDGNELLHSITKLAMSGHVGACLLTSRHLILLTTVGGAAEAESGLFILSRLLSVFHINKGDFHAHYRLIGEF